VTGPKLNEYPAARPGIRRLPVTAEQPRGARARARYIRISAYKVRQVLDLIRGQDVDRALEILKFCERDAALVVGKLLDSAVANADKNHELHDAEELYVSACFADEGPTLKRWRPRARGRATRIRKRTCHITVIVSRLPDVELQKRRASDTAASAARRRRIAGQKAAAERSRTRRRRADAGTPEAVEGDDLEDESAVEADAAAEEEAAEEEAAAEEEEAVDETDPTVAAEASGEEDEDTK
jgi:large subunit ribosomal protein L22